MFHVALGAADGVDHRLARVGGFERAAELAVDPEPDHGQRLLHPLAQRAGSAGVGTFELAGEDLELFERSWVVGLPPRPAHPGLDLRPIALGEVPKDVPFLVPLMATPP